MASTLIEHKYQIGQWAWFARFTGNNKIMPLKGRISKIEFSIKENGIETMYWVDYVNPQNDNKEYTVTWEDWMYTDKSSMLARYEQLGMSEEVYN